MVAGGGGLHSWKVCKYGKKRCRVPSHGRWNNVRRKHKTRERQNTGAWYQPRARTRETDTSATTKSTKPGSLAQLTMRSSCSSPPCHTSHAQYATLAPRMPWKTKVFPGQPATHHSRCRPC